MAQTEPIVNEPSRSFLSDISAINSIEAVPSILQVICNVTGMGFAAVARVTEGRWVACSVLDRIAFGLKPGEELIVGTTICNEIRQSREGVVIDDVAKDRVYADHPAPALYGFQSYISMPIILRDDSMFGTLRAIDPQPHRLNVPGTVAMFKLFSELIAFHICPSSDDLRHVAGFQKGGSGSSVIEITRHAVDAASDGLRLSGV
jgi:GAF domain-containing protein